MTFTKMWKRGYVCGNSMDVIQLTLQTSPMRTAQIAARKNYNKNQSKLIWSKKQTAY